MTDALWQDIVFATRLLRKSPILTAAIILTLALGVGVNTAVFSVVNAFLLRPLAVRDSERLVVLASHRTSSRTLRGVSHPDLQDYRAASADLFEDIAGYSVGFLGLAPGGGPPERVLVTWVTNNYFPLLDLKPVLGSTILPGDSAVVLGHSTWQRRFGGDPSIVGRTAKVNGRPYTIVGVLPPDFAGTFAFSESELYLPFNRSDLDDRQARGVHALARLRPHVTIAAAQAAMEAVAQRLAAQYPVTNANVTVSIIPEHLARPEEDQSRSNALGAAISLVLVGIVMIVAAVNVANLLLAQATGRRQELAIRAALGAGRGRLIRQMLTESLLLATLGGAAGVLLGTWAARLLQTMRLPGDLPVHFDFQLDGRVLAYSVAVALVAGILVGLVTAWRASSADIDRTGRASSGVHSHRIRAALVVSQIALCFVLLVTAGLFTRSLFEAQRADLGFDPSAVLNVHMSVGDLGYTEARGRAFFDEVERRVRLLPGVRNVSYAFTIPLGYIRVNNLLEVEGKSERQSAGKNIVGPEYFETMGIPIARGRAFRDADDQRANRVAIVNQQLAHLLWPGRDPIGLRFKSGDSWVEVVGVTATGKYQFLFEDPQPYFYLPIAQQYSGLRVLQVRTSSAPEALAPAVERVIQALEPDLPLYDVQNMTRALGSGFGLFPVRMGAVAAVTFGLLGLALALVGVYGVFSYMTTQRAHEIGVRMAVGATTRDIAQLILREALRLAASGIAAGMLLAAASSRILGIFLFGVSSLDAWTLAGVTSILAIVALLACAIPAWRAAHLNPTIALRCE